MRVKFLGTGTSTGVPEVGCLCAVCTSADSRDKRLRASVMVYTNNGKNILIDCTPDFREQMIRSDFLPIDALLITHEHYDHVGGIDDLRPFCKFKDVNIYAEQYVAKALRTRIPYCFNENKYPGVPDINLIDIDENSFYVDTIEIVPIRLMHSKLPIFGYRIHNFAYLTDVKTIPEQEYKKLENLDVLVIDALRIKEHNSHQSLEQALANAARIGAKKTYLTHMSHHMGLHAEVKKILPQNVFIPFDGLEIEI
ncbi:MAG: hypothetical protein RL662_1710 [Bacteroidota bacterium]|jgi:phosphoribosyl 1,2-cyclic phosphate phosphodiesterase